MKKLLNTLYITTPESYISKDGMNIVISVEQIEIFRISILNIEGIVTFGYIGASPGVMKLCTDYGVSLTFLSPSGRFISRIQGPTKGNVLLRKQQYKNSDNNEFCLHVSRIFIAGKIQNYRTILKRFNRDNEFNIEVDKASDLLTYKKSESLKAHDIAILRGIEGDAANIYFKIFHNLILNQRGDFSFSGRNRRPPKDAVNAMLSFVYTLIANDVSSALETVGLDPYVGFLHALRPGRISLALDMIEELRAYLGDRLVLSLINRKQISIKDFILQGEEGIVMTDSGRKILISACKIEKKKLLFILI
jgi:CRISPR-associated protein Cas1